MTRIGILADTHGHFDPKLPQALEGVDQIWHLGDFGNLEVAARLQAIAPVFGVWGNIDGPELRQRFPEELTLVCEGVRAWMLHIGGHPGRYPPAVRKRLEKDRPDLFLCGHSHILRVEKDRFGVLYINPGACGRQGFHLFKTVMRMELHERQVASLKVVELGAR